jgi:hypothetical protein
MQEANPARGKSGQRELAAAALQVVESGDLPVGMGGLEL